MVGPLRPFGVEADERLAHFERGARRVDSMGRIVERRVPEGHDGVAHVFVDGAFLLQDDVGQRRQILVEERRKLDRREAFGQGRERPDVAEHHGQLALLPAELKLLRVFGEAGDDGGRHVAAEGRADLAHLPALLAIELPDAGEEYEAGREGGHDGVEENSLPSEPEPAEVGEQSGGARAEYRGPVNGNERKKRDQRQRKHGAGEGFRARRPVRPLQGGAGENLLDELRMRLDSRRRRIERGRDDVRKQRGARADEHDLACEISEIGVRLEDFPGRDRAAGVGLGEPHPQFSVRLNRNHHIADLYRLDALAPARRVPVARR